MRYIWIRAIYPLYKWKETVYICIELITLTNIIAFYTRIYHIHQNLPCLSKIFYSTYLMLNPKTVAHCCFRHPGDKFQMGPNLDLSKALNNGYRPLLFRIEGYPGHFGFLVRILLLKIHHIKWEKAPKFRRKKLFFWCLHLNLAGNSSTSSAKVFCETQTCIVCSRNIFAFEHTTDKWLQIFGKFQIWFHNMLQITHFSNCVD